MGYPGLQHAYLPADYYCETMKLEGLFGTLSKNLPVWMALCTGRADGSNPKSPAHAKHAILAMARAKEPKAESSICALLQSNGWLEPEIKRLKAGSIIHSDHPIMRACHENAIKNGAGIVVYSDPIDEVVAVSGGSGR
jgi:hypothetical protein